MADKLINAAKKIKFEIAEYKKMLDAWDKDENLWVPEKALINVFNCDYLCVSNIIEDEYKKVTLLNHAYGTRLYNSEVLLLSHYLSDNSRILNRLLNKGDAEAVSRITNALKIQNESQERFCYVFATKYCSFAAPSHQKDAYPIYDNMVSKVYIYRRNIWGKESSGISNSDLGGWKGGTYKSPDQYEEYKKAVYKMREFVQKNILGGEYLSVKTLDQYLWKAMYEYSKKEK